MAFCIEITNPSPNFRNVNVYPNPSEILGQRKYSLKKNIKEGRFSSIDQYLNIHFHLLREDFLTTLRDGMKSYHSKRKSTTLKIYENVEVFNLNEEEKPLLIIKHDSFSEILENEKSKKLMVGSLLLFTNNDFKTIKFLGKVISRNEEHLIQNKILIKCHEKVMLPSVSTWRMAECLTYFEPYFQVMKALQNTSEERFPMEKYLIQVDGSCIKSPKYLSSIFKISDSQSFQNNLALLNTAQKKAFIAALSQEFAVIQGPPGTGKTFLGLKIAETLIRNYQLWYRKSPMLVISHKNHALDQFVEGLIPVTQNLVRVGGQSKSEKLQEYNLANKTPSDLSNLFSKLTLKERRNTYLSTMEDALVIAMTTTGAARMKETLEDLQCPIVIVEEAAEVLESHVVAALTKHCQHLILLGDHKQLKPSTSDHVIGTQYHLDVSLFERMVTNGIQCYKLEVQHRMVPEISLFTKSTIYPFLEDHESVKDRPKILGVDKNVFFINHNYPEETANLTSKKNTHEAEFLVRFAKYLIMNGHNPEDIAILTMYAAQVKEMQKLIPEEAEFVQISTLDGFQGQEAGIVLLSLVRSKSIGFLRAENRICVALSRAKNGLYIMGHANLLSNNSEVWSTVIKTMTESNSIGSKLVVRCQKHPETTTEIEFAKNFQEFVPDGGCSRDCDFKLSCGHKCRYKCHILPTHPEGYECKCKCERTVTCPRDPKHPKYVCDNLCFEECKQCSVEVRKKFECGHEVTTECSNEICPEEHS